MKFFKVLLLIFFFIPAVAQAAGVGFVPSAGIWFSSNNFTAKELVRIYSVVINNDYAALDGAVGFYDNGKLIDTVMVRKLLKESAQQVRVFWQPEEGPHAISARFVKVVATDEQGKQHELALNEINSVIGLPLQIGGVRIVPISEQLVGGQDAALEDQFPTSSVMVIVKKQGDTMTIAADTKVTPVEILTNKTAAIKDAVAGIVGKLSLTDWLAKNRQVLVGTPVATATAVLTTGLGSTSTAGQVFTKASAIVAGSSGAIGKLKDYWYFAGPYVALLQPWWLSISHDNSPKQIAIIIVIVVVAWFVLKRLNRLLFFWLLLRHTRQPRK